VKVLLRVVVAIMISTGDGLVDQLRKIRN